MSNSTPTPDILIVGAGLAGLMAATVLKEHGRQVVLVDKGRSVGGRLATRRIGPGRADHGAQFFTVRSDEFRQWVDRWLEADLIYEWSTGWSDGSIDTAEPDGHPRYATRGGMNALPQHLAEGLDVRLEVRLTAVAPTENGWRAEDETGQRYTGRALLLTPPAPQSLALLTAGQTPLAASDKTALESIAFAPCVAGMFWVEGPVNLPEPGALQRPDHAISWIADNLRKGISPEARLITVHAGPDYSRDLWDAAEDEALAALRSGLEPHLEPTATIREGQLKRWRYALPTNLHPERSLVADNLPPLVFAGDAFGGPRVEGAALSGLAAGQALAALTL